MQAKKRLAPGGSYLSGRARGRFFRATPLHVRHRVLVKLRHFMMPGELLGPGCGPRRHRGRPTLLGRQQR
jgi:hypothetical protein